ncbi:MAG: trypsin-like serine protease, partial [Cytophagaceae bacterium]
LGVTRETPEGEVAYLFCSGTLIRPDVVLTAAHCLNGLQTEQAELAGSLTFLYQPDNSVNGTQAQKVAVRGMTLHPDYLPASSQSLSGKLEQIMENEESRTYITQKCGTITDGSVLSALRWLLAMPTYDMLRQEESFFRCLIDLKEVPNVPAAPMPAMQDIAVVFLQEPVLNLAPIPLAAPFNHGDGGDELIAAGYGVQRPEGDFVGDGLRSQQAGKVNMVAWGAFESRLDDAQSQVCYGDSGGSLYRRRGEALELIGVLVRSSVMPLSKRCSGGGVVTNVAAYADWIEEVILSGPR